MKFCSDFFGRITDGTKVTLNYNLAMTNFDSQLDYVGRFWLADTSNPTSNYSGSANIVVNQGQSTGGGIGHTSTGITSRATLAQLADGTVAYRLQAGRTDLVWGQRIGTDTEPVMTNDESYRVYRSINGGYTNDPTLAYEGLQQDVNDNYLLGCVWAWQDFAALVNGGTTNINARMTADIDLGDDQTMIGTSDAKYQGIFDGQGHQLTVHYVNPSEGFFGPFSRVQNSMIKNLHVAGSITTQNRFTGAIVGTVANGTTCTLQNCRSSVACQFTYDGNSYVQSGGIFGTVNENATLTMTDCLFDGSLSTMVSSRGMGGMVGWNYKGTVNMDNCLFAPQSVDVSTEYIYTLIGPSSVSINQITNCYYATSIGTVQGTQATAEQLADGTITTKLQNNREEEVWVQDVLTNQPQLAIFANKYTYTVPSSGIGTFSAKAKFAVPEGLTAHYCKTYNSDAGTISVANIDGAVPANTGVLLRGTPGETYTLTGTNSEAATVTDNALVAVTEETSIAQESDGYVNFELSGGEFKKVNAAGGTVKANRAYLHILKSSLPTEAESIALAWDGETTGIANLNVDANDNFDANAPMYNLAGQRVGKSYKGIVVVNGKKVLIK